MRRTSIIMALSVIMCYSCKDSIELSDIEGIWSFHSYETQYSEVLIDSFQMVGFNGNGEMFPIKFFLRNDSIFFPESGYSGEIQIRSDTLFSMTMDTLSIIFLRLDDSLRNIYGIKNLTDHEFEKYYNQFYQRAMSKEGKVAFRLWFEENYHMSLDSARAETDEMEEDTLKPRAPLI